MSKKKCFYCGSFNQEESLFCEKCGKKLEYTCPNCGYIVHTATKFCVNCGEKFDFSNRSMDEVNDQHEEASGQNEEKEKEVLVCSSCGTKNDSSSLFCEGCGKRLIVDDEEKEIETESEETDSQVEVDSSEEETVDESAEEVTSDEEEDSDQEL